MNHSASTVSIAVKSFGYIFQPIVDLSGNIVAFEALARCSASKNISVYHGSSKLIGLIPFEKQCIEFFSSVSQLFDFYGEAYRYSFNIEPANCSMEHMALISEIAHEYNVPTNLIDLEVIEKSRDELFKPALEVAKDMGFSLVLDDFGAGYSNVESLLDYPFDKIKFDKVFTQHDSLTKNLLCAVHDVIKKHGFLTVIEGVENVDIMNFAKRIGADYYQGWHFGEGNSLQDTLHNENYMKRKWVTEIV